MGAPQHRDQGRVSPTKSPSSVQLGPFEARGACGVGEGEGTVMGEGCQGRGGQTEAEAASVHPGEVALGVSGHRGHRTELRARVSGPSGIHPGQWL